MTLDVAYRVIEWGHSHASDERELIDVTREVAKGGRIEKTEIDKSVVAFLACARLACDLTGLHTVKELMAAAEAGGKMIDAGTITHEQFEAECTRILRSLVAGDEALN